MPVQTQIVTELEQLSLKEFSGKKVYEKGHKIVLGLQLNLVENVKNFHILNYALKNANILRQYQNDNFYTIEGILQPLKKYPNNLI